MKKLPLKPKKKKKKEIIDYSSIQPDIDGKNDITSPVVHAAMVQESTDPVGKVHHWLKNQYNLPKSKSTPVGLTNIRTKPTIKPRVDKNKSHSVSNIPQEKDKVRVQVVYKPPFKFSLKLRKPDKTSAIVEPVRKSPRTAILVQSVATSKQKNAEKKTQGVPAPYDTIDLATVDIDSNVHTVQSDLDGLLSDENDYVSVEEWESQQFCCNVNIWNFAAVLTLTEFHMLQCQRVSEEKYIFYGCGIYYVFVTIDFFVRPICIQSSGLWLAPTLT